MPTPLTPAQFAKLSLADQREYRRKFERLEDLERRDRARRDFGAFFEYTSPYLLEPWQRSVCDLYTELIVGEQRGRRIKIHKPPQHGGSILTSQRLPAFGIGNNPNTRVRLITYNETHSERFSKTVLGIMQEPSYQTLFPEVKLPNVAAVGEWSTSVRASMKDSQTSFMALGLGSGWIGSGGDLVIVDDPYKTREEAFSDTINEKIKNWHNEVLMTRVNPDTNVIVMYHSWNERDYGCYLDEQGGWENWRYAAICDSDNDPCGRNIGEALSPRYPVEYLEAIRDGGYYNGQKLDGIGSSAFESLYQGNPKSRDGNLFKIEMFRPVKDFRRMENSYFIGGFDWASSSEPTADRTSYSLWYVRPDGTRTKVWAAFGRFNPSDTMEFAYKCCKYSVEKYYPVAPIIFYIEQGIGAGEVYVKDIQKRCAEFGLRSESTKGKEKEIRALPMIALMETGNIDYVDDTLLPVQQRAGFSYIERWNQEWITEATSFPGGKHDDLVDSDTLCINIAARLKIDD